MNMLLYISLMLFSFTAFAAIESPFIERTKNYNLDKQLEKDPHRIGPSHEKFSLAADFELWKAWRDTKTYYHGPGYWVDSYFELRPFNDLDINLKAIFENGTTSKGYNTASSLYTIFGVSWSPRVLGENWNFLVRFFDLDRNTIGSGLFFEDREMSGLLLQADDEEYFFKLRLPGTAVLQVMGDLWSLEIYRQSSVNRFGLHSFAVEKYGKTEIDFVSGEPVIVLNDLAPVTSLFLSSRQDVDSYLLYRAEVAFSGEEWAGLSVVGFQNLRMCKFCFRVYGQYRFYEKGIIDDIAGNTEYDFVPYNFKDRSFQNAHNILIYDDDVQSYGINIDFNIKLSDKWFFESLNEAGKFEYLNLNSNHDKDFLYTTQRFGLCPYRDLDNNCIYFFYSNKVVNALSPEYIASPQQVFLREDIWGIQVVLYL